MLLETLWPTLAIVASLGFLAPLLVIAGADVAAGYRSLFSASFGSDLELGVLLVTSVPLILVGLGVAIPYRAGLFNIGGEGQLLVGAVAAVTLAVNLPGATGTPVSFILPLAAALLAGGALGAIAGALKAWRGIHEIVTTIMLSFLAIFLVQYLTRGPLQAPGAVYPTTSEVPTGYRLSALGTNGVLPVGFIVAIVTLVAVAALTMLTRRGWRQRLIGLNPALAARHGVRVGREQVVVLALGGAIAGLGGASEVLGNQLRVGLNFSPGWGFDAVAIALLARGNPLAVLPFALYFGFLRNGASVLQTDLAVSPDLVLVLGAGPVIFVAAVIGYRAYKRAVAEPPVE
jgi:simple sugar transport system permease protein